MSLDVYLTRKRDELPESAKAAALLRTHGFNDLAFDIECRYDCSDSETLYEANITHNLNTMADKAGIYEHLWRPDEIGVTKASQLIEPLRSGLERLRADPALYRTYNAKNGWGLYENFVPWVARYLEACEEYPDADVSVSR